MYIQRIIYEGCCSFEDTNREVSCDPNSLFNLTQNYYIIADSNIYVEPKLENDPTYVNSMSEIEKEFV